MSIHSKLSKLQRKLSFEDPIDIKALQYVERFKKYSFKGTRCSSINQYEAVITRWYHTIEKGLSYSNFRAGFGKKNIEMLLNSLENYVKDGYSKETFFFQTALSVLDAYIEKNNKYGVDNVELQERIVELGGTKNLRGGVLAFVPITYDELRTLDYKGFVESRHSMRHFSSDPVDIAEVNSAIELAQHTPSACNRQSWRTIIVENKDTLKKVLANQNGNEGFGQEFDKLLLVVVDTRYFNNERELFQPYIDGGMYAQSVINALYYEHIAACPLSASLQKNQEENIRRLLSLDDAEIPIIFIGIGNYPNEEICLTTRSERKKPWIEII